MNDNMRIEREISIRDLLWFILKEWRKIIVACILGVLVFILFFVYKNRGIILRNNANEVQNVEQEEQLLDEDLLSDGSIDVDVDNVYQATIDAYNQSIKSSRVVLSKLQEYANESILMKLDSYNVPRMVIGYDIDLLVENNNEVPDFIYKKIYQKYLDFFNNDLNWGKIENEVGSKQKYLREVIGIGATTNYMGFNITIRFMNEDLIYKVRDIVIPEMEKAINEFSNEESFKHSIKIKEHNIDYIRDTSAYDAQNANANNINSVLTRIDSLETKLLKFSKDKKNTGASIQKISIKKLLKYIIVGIILGGFMMVFYYFCIYVFGGKMHIVDELKTMYGYELFGVVIEKKKNKKFLGFIDEWLKKWMKDYYYNDDEDNAILRIVTYIKNIQDDKIAITSSVENDFVNKIIEKVKEHLKKEGKNINVIQNIVSSASALKDLIDVDSVVLVEQLEESKMHDVMIECDNMKSLGKKVCGYIVVTK